MDLINREKLFFVKDVQELDLCGSKMIQFTGSEFSKPTDFQRLEYKEHNLNNCENCKKSYADTLSNIKAKHDTFPNCCKMHENLVNETWFKPADFEDMPVVYTDKLFYTWHHILHFIDTDDWRDEIVDYIDYIVSTFGSFPENYGGPLYLSSYFGHLVSFIKSSSISKVKKKMLYEYIENLKNPPASNQTDLNILLKTYNEWFKSFPFNISFLSHLKEHFRTNIPFIKQSHYNKYRDLVKSTLQRKESLLDHLLKATRKIITEINVLHLYEKGAISDIGKVRLELVFEQRRQKLRDGYDNDSVDPDTRYRKILKEWFNDELVIISEIDNSIKAQEGKNNNLYNDLLNACCRMQENKIFWGLDENTRTRQILDLLAANYFTKDQSQYGKSSTGKKPGSVDGVIVDKSQTEHFIEAVNADSIGKDLIRLHINKLEDNYDSKGLLNKYLVVYCNVADNSFDGFQKKYAEYLDSEMPFKWEKLRLEALESKYVNIKVIRSIHKRENREVALYHILLKMPVVKE